MTRSTGKRAAQRRREELFSAELRLRRVQLHLVDAMARAAWCRGLQDAMAYKDAFSLVSEALLAVLREVRELA